MHMLRLFGLAVSVVWLLAVGCEQSNSSASAPAKSPAQSDSSATQAETDQPLKVGYINSVELLSLMPEAMEADQAIQNYAAGQERRFQQLAQEYQQKIQEAQAEAQSGTMTPMKQQVAMQEIQKLEQQLQEMQANSQQRVASRREELLSPVLARADSIVQAVAKANGYDIIYDAPALMYADSSLDVMPLVKEAMGVTDETNGTESGSAQGGQ